MEEDASKVVTVASKEVVVWRPWVMKGMRWLAFAAAIAPLAVMIVGGGMFDMDKPARWADIVGTAWGTAAISGVASFFLTPLLRKRRAIVRADGANIEMTNVWGRTRTIAKSDVRQAAVVADPLTPGVALELSGGRSMSIRTASLEEAQRLLAAVTSEAGQARYQTQAQPSARAAGAGCLSLAAVMASGIGLFQMIRHGLPGVVGGASWIGIVAAVLFLFFLLTSRTIVEVGADGVVFREMFTSRFVPFRELESIHAEDRRVEMRFANGAVEQVKLSQITRDQVIALDDRLSRAFQASRGQAGGGRSTALDRAGRPVSAWRAHLSELIARGEGYRDAALTREEAEAVLAAGDASPEHRLGAALALVAKDKAGARERVRIAAESCANPRLRVALSGLAEGDVEDAAVLEAIGEEAASTEAATRS